MRTIFNTFVKEEELVETECDNVAVVVFICKQERLPVVYNVDGIDDVDYAVMRAVRDLTACCNYHYEFVKKIQNVYFYR